jgi:hypothetical protein
MLDEQWLTRSAEVMGHMPSPDTWKPIDRASCAVWQRLASTRLPPASMAIHALWAIADGEIHRRPPGIAACPHVTGGDADDREECEARHPPQGR